MRQPAAGSRGSDVAASSGEQVRCTGLLDHFRKGDSHVLDPVQKESRVEQSGAEREQKGSRVEQKGIRVVRTE